MKKTIWYLVKIFKEEQHAEQFISGNLYLNRLSYFKKIEEKGDDGRLDKNEAVAMWFDGLNLSIPGVGSCEITKKDLAEPISISYQHHDYLNVFCMYAVHTIGFECVDGNIKYSEDRAAQLKRQLEIDERCFEFGDFAVIVPAVQFLDRVKKTLQARGNYFQGKLIDYYDESFNCEIEEKEIPFKKQNKYSYQNEFRICVDTKTIGEEAINIDIGDIKDISAKTESSNLNALFGVNSIKC